MRKSYTTTLSEIIKEFIKKNNLEHGINSAKIIYVWKEVTGNYISNATTNIYVSKNKLFVKINSSLIRSEILLIKTELIKRINKNIGFNFIDDIIVR